MGGRTHLILTHWVTRIALLVFVLWVALTNSGLILHAKYFLHAPPDISQLKKISLPNGFSIQRYADVSTIGSPRMMQFDTDGALYIAIVDAGKVVKLLDKNHDGEADQIIEVATQLNRPNSVAILNDTMLISNQDGIVKLTRQDGQWSQPQTFVSNLPTGGHTLKTVRIGPDKHVYINVGSSCNVCVENEPKRATILRYTLEGKAAGYLTTFGRHTPSPIWATGLRNSQAFVWHPVTKAMFATNEGADNRSETKNGRVNDALPPEHINHIEAGGFYGWPYCWADINQPSVMFQDPNFLADTDKCSTATAPAMTLISHSTPMGMSFLHQSQFPAEYRQDAIVALHGSWNRAQPSGYSLMRVQFEHNQPVAVQPFAQGWLSQDNPWGRPVDVAVGTDGAVYVSDDRTGWIYRISYQKN